MQKTNWKAWRVPAVMAVIGVALGVAAVRPLASLVRPRVAVAAPPAAAVVDDDAPVCGVKVLFGAGPNCKWPEGKVTWRQEVGALGPLSAAEVQACFERGLARWAEASGVTLVHQPTGPVNLLCVGAAMDGHNKVLADCQIPCSLPQSIQLRMRVDITDTWDRQRLEWVVWHEAGHGIGISHLGKGNIMFPSLDLGIQASGPDDLAESRARYGPPKAGPPAPPADLLDICAGTVTIWGIPHRLVRVDKGGALGRLIGQKAGPWGTLILLDAEGRPVYYFLSPDRPN